MPANVTFDQHKRLIYNFAWKVQRRMHAAGARTMQLEDLVQELSIAWCVARDRWDESLNVPFTAYLMRGMQQCINRFAKYELREHAVAPFSIDEPLESGTSRGDLIPDDSEMATLEQKNFRDLVLRLVSSRSRRFLEILESPPREVVEQLDYLRIRAEDGRARGLHSVAPRNLNTGLVFDLLGYSRPERSQVLSEIEMVVSKLSELSHEPSNKSLMTYEPANPDAPGCYGSALAYRPNGVECPTCQFAEMCRPIAEACLATLRAKLGIAASTAPKRRFTPAEQPAEGAGTVIAQVPKKVANLMQRIEERGIRVGEALARRENPFPADMKFLLVTAHLLLRSQNGLSRTGLHHALRRTLGWSESTATSHVTQAFQLFIALGVAEVRNEALNLKVNHV